MRPAHVYASMSAQQHTELITALHGPWRNATRIMMVVLSAAGWSASEIADLLHYDPKTVRAWIARHHAEGLLLAGMIIGALGVLDSWWAVLVLPACFVIGFGFAMLIAAVTPLSRSRAATSPGCPSHIARRPTICT